MGKWRIVERQASRRVFSWKYLRRRTVSQSASEVLTVPETEGREIRPLNYILMGPNPKRVLLLRNDRTCKSNATSGSNCETPPVYSPVAVCGVPPSSGLLTPPLSGSGITLAPIGPGLLTPPYPAQEPTPPPPPTHPSIKLRLTLAVQCVEYHLTPTHFCHPVTRFLLLP